MGPQKELRPEAAETLTAMQFDGGAAVTVHGRVTTLLFPPPGADGVMVVRATEGGDRYAFSMAATRDLAKQGFTRNSLGPGQEVTVSGVLAASGGKLGDLTAARADSVTVADGDRVFDRAKL